MPDKRVAVIRDNDGNYQHNCVENYRDLLLHVRTPSDTSEKALKRIGQLCAIEADIRGIQAGQRLAERQLKTIPLLKSLERWLREKSVHLCAGPMTRSDILCGRWLGGSRQHQEI